MALPATLNKNEIQGSDAANTIDTGTQTLMAAIQDIVGIPDNTAIAAAMASVVASGLVALHIKDAAASPSTDGTLQRNGSVLEFYDGTNSQVIAFTADVAVSGAYDLNGSILTLDVDGDLDLVSSTDDKMAIVQGVNPVFAVVSSSTAEDGLEIHPVASAASTTAILTTAGNSTAIALDIQTKGGAAVMINGSVITTGGLGNVVEDTTPQLGGNLDTNGKSIVFDASALLQMNGQRIDFDANDNTSVRAASDDTLTWEFGGTDVWTWTAGHIDVTNASITCSTVSMASMVTTDATVTTATITTASITSATIASIAGGPAIVGAASIAAASFASVTDINVGTLDVATSASITSANLESPTVEGAAWIDASFSRNMGLTASTVSSTLSFNLVAGDLTNQSSTNVTQIAFHDTSASIGGVDIVSMTAFASVTLSDGSTLGIGAASAGRVYFYAINNSGTVELAIARQALFDESVLHTTTAEGGAGGADSDTTLYSTTARTDVPVRLVGIAEITAGAVAGSWETKPAVLSTWHPGMKKTGDEVQQTENNDSAVATGTTTMPDDDTIPQNTEGDEWMTQAIIPTNALNKLRIESHIWVAGSVVAWNAVALFQDSTADALASGLFYNPSNNAIKGLDLHYTMVAATTSSTTFKIRSGMQTSGTTTFNGTSGGREHGGVINSYLRIKEVYA